MEKAKWLLKKGISNSCEKKRNERQRRKGKIYPFECFEFQRIARRDKKAFLSDQCKEIVESNWERLEISSRKLEIQRNISCKDGHNKGQKWYKPNRSRRY